MVFIGATEVLSFWYVLL